LGGDGGAPASAQIDSPEVLASDNNGTLFVSGSGNERVRKVIAQKLQPSDSFTTLSSWTVSRWPYGRPTLDP